MRPVSEARSPRIARLSWGRIELEDGRTFKDAVLYPGGAEPWDWTRTGTTHRRGIQPADLDPLIEAGCRAVVLSQGMEGRLEVARETIERLEREGLTYVALPTREATERYNELTETTLVGGLFHSTC
ncbi:MAG: hypothetical protein D6815_05675 [Candidatus Dadabacteria bacterium]|nr:MAG: hypothetical protein D6815_05675 [Candidatus Dadabacteria bacterium]